LAKVGRPRTIEDPDEFKARAEAYFAETEASGKPPTITGLALYVGLTDRSRLHEYEMRPEFSHAVKAAKARVEAWHEARLSGQNVAGSIFWLKNYGWRDTQEVNVNAARTVLDMSDGELAEIAAGKAIRKAKSAAADA
jgi:hypothetical protein